MSSPKVLVFGAIRIIVLSLVIIGVFGLFRTVQYNRQYIRERGTTMNDLKQLQLGLYMYEYDFNISVLPDEYEKLVPNYIGEGVLQRIRSNLIFLELSKDEIEKDILIKVKGKYGLGYSLYADGHVDLVDPK